MKADLDRLMQKRQLSAIVVAGDESYSDVRDYMSNGAHITGGFIVKKAGDDVRLYVNGMEIEEANKSGYACKTYGDVGYFDLIQEYPMEEATVRLWGNILADAGVHEGRVGIYGVGAINVYLELVERLKSTFPQYDFLGESGNPTLFQEAYLTKDPQEIDRIRTVAEKTNEVAALAWSFIASQRIQEGTLVNSEGEAVTIGTVKRLIRRELMERGLEDTGMIFAQGRDGGFPHSRGEDNEALKEGQAIVFDLFPREMGGGYHHDMTRTWCIGYAPPQVQRAYDDVMEAFNIALETYALGKPTYALQEAVLDSFEAKGHPTARSTSNPTEGYVHSLGHGVGLNIHEAPSMHHLRRDDVFQVGNFITIEPGLYYPQQGFGVRVEDSFIISESGELVSITPFKKDLVITLEG